MVATNSTVLHALSFGSQLSSKLFGGIDAVVGAVVSDGNSDGSSLMLKFELGLNRSVPVRPT
jgi:hypothetical protein